MERPIQVAAHESLIRATLSLFVDGGADVQLQSYADCPPAELISRIETALTEARADWGANPPDHPEAARLLLSSRIIPIAAGATLLLSLLGFSATIFLPTAIAAGWITIVLPPALPSTLLFALSSTWTLPVAIALLLFVTSVVLYFVHRKLMAGTTDPVTVAGTLKEMGEWHQKTLFHLRNLLRTEQSSPAFLPNLLLQAGMQAATERQTQENQSSLIKAVTNREATPAGRASCLQGNLCQAAASLLVNAKDSTVALQRLAQAEELIKLRNDARRKNLELGTISQKMDQVRTKIQKSFETYNNPTTSH